MIASRATDRPSKSLNPVAAVSTEVIIAYPVASPPGPGEGRLNPRDSCIDGCLRLEVDKGHGPNQWTRRRVRRVKGTKPGRIDPVAQNTAHGSEKVKQEKSSSNVSATPGQQGVHDTIIATGFEVFQAAQTP
ncbi:hypothetical protein THAOC_06752, partial [Thalassiosira oceanica]